MSYFLALPTQQQGIFVRKVSYTELTAGGCEFNDPSSKHYQSLGQSRIMTTFGGNIPCGRRKATSTPAAVPRP